MGSRRAVVYLALVFVLGFACGALATYWAEKNAWFHSGEKEDHSPLQWLTRELDLTPEQQKELEPILDKTGREYYRLFEKVRPEFEAIREETRGKIRALLTEAQRAKFEELVRKIEEREARHREKYASPGSPAENEGKPKESETQ